LFNATIYGGGHDSWVAKIEAGNPKKNKPPKPVKNRDKKDAFPFWREFKTQTKELIDLIYLHNPDIAEKVCTPELELWERKSRVMSYFCGTIENELTFKAYKYTHKNGYAPQRGVSWGYDGYTIPPLKDDPDYEAKVNAYVLKKTGFNLVRFIHKDFKEDEVLWDAIEERKALVIAEVIEPEIAIPSSGKDEYTAWKIEFEKQWCKIINISCFLRICYDEKGDFEKYIFQTESQLKTAYKHVVFTEPIICKKTGKHLGDNTKSCIKEWLDDPNILCYDDCEIYPPPLVCPPNKFNMWRPFKYEGCELPETCDTEGIKMYFNHLEMLCNHNKEVYMYLSNWLAHMFQRPAEKIGVAITLTGQEGIGKNIFTDHLGEMLGAGKKLETAAPERDVWGNFNSLMASAYFVVLSEVDKRNGVGADGRIKALITDKKMPINAKGKDQYDINSYHRFITNTNNADPNKTHKGDRRWVIIRCSDEKKGDTEYFTRLAERINRPETMRDIYWFLTTKIDLSKWDYRQLPRTEYHEILIEGNRPPLECFLEHFTIQHQHQESVEYLGTQMLDQFRQWKQDTGYAFEEKMNESQLLKRIMTELNIKNVDQVIVKTKRITAGQKRSYNINALREHFKIEGVILN
jgi:hypothetical protein